MKLTTLTPLQALAPLPKQKAFRSDINTFKKHLNILLTKIKDIDQSPFDESEEHLKNNVRDFLRDTYYAATNAINTKDKKDLVIHLSKKTTSDVGVIIEAKRPSNTAEMISADCPNKKALQEIILYYLNERHKTPANFQLKQLIITNKVDLVLDKIKSKQNFIIKAKEEIAQGIVPDPDRVNNSNISKIPKAKILNENIKVGDGVFVVNKGYFKKLSVKEKKLY